MEIPVFSILKEGLILLILYIVVFFLIRIYRILFREIKQDGFNNNFFFFSFDSSKDHDKTLYLSVIVYIIYSLTNHGFLIWVF